MSAPPADVADRLERLAEHAPGGALDPDAVWSRGRRRHRARVAGALTAVLALGLLGTTTTPVLLERAQRVGPADTARPMVLPDVVRQPGGWEPAFPPAPGRLSAVGFGTRSGLWSSRPAWWGVSAETGESRFLELRGDAGTLVTPALSADGRRLAYWVTGEVAGEPLSMSASSEEEVDPVAGVAVLDLRTGARTTWTVESEHGLGPSGLAWAGDVLWWSAGQVLPAGGTARRVSDVVVRTWDLSTGERDQPTAAATVDLATSGAETSDGFLVHAGSLRLTRVLGSGGPERLMVRLRDDLPPGAGIADPAMSPDGARVAALLLPDADTYDDGPKQVLVGAVAGRRADLQPVGDLEAEDLVGWRSPDQVVVASLADVEEGRPPRAERAWAVDVTTGERTDLVELSGNTPRFAAEAWTAEVVPAPDAPFAPDPRLAGLALLVGALVAWRVRVRVRRRR